MCIRDRRSNPLLFEQIQSLLIAQAFNRILCFCLQLSTLCLDLRLDFFLALDQRDVYKRQTEVFKASDLEMELRSLFHLNHSVVLPYSVFADQ